MKRKAFTSILYLLSSIYFCQAQQKVFFINPAFTEKSAKLKPEAEGIWASDFISNIHFQKKGDNFYHLWYGDSRHRTVYEAVFFQVNNQLFLDLRGIRDSIWDKDYEAGFLPSHSVSKARISNDTLYFAELNYSWFYDLISQKKSGLNYLFNDNGTIVTSSTDLTEYFLSVHSNDPGAFDKEDAIVIKNNRAQEKVASKPEIENAVADPLNLQDYPLSFPLKDGWLGADNDASIPISNGRSLWLFGDTYVGDKDQHNRDGSFVMVHSSAAITGKSSDGKYSIQYYWKDMYSSNPKSLFESYTDRYVYWIKDGFVFNKDLYVLLRKVGAWPGAKIDQPFSFTLGGSSFARVRNFESKTPDQWSEELIPFPFLYDSTFDCEQFVKSGNYIYFFVNRQNKPNNITQLIRLPIVYIDSAEGHFEYFSKAQTWKRGKEADDMLTILNGEPGNTIRYHADTKLWVMVRGPGFLNRRIVIHTAPSLTGPWSDGEVVYECPEQNPGSAIYDKNNFCYLGREHPQFYNKKNKTMLLTYDCNTSDFNAIKRNLEIYVPRIIAVKLKK